MNSLLEKELEIVKQTSPDILIDRLGKRVSTSEGGISRLSKEIDAYRELQQQLQVLNSKMLLEIEAADEILRV